MREAAFSCGVLEVLNRIEVVTTDDKIGRLIDISFSALMYKKDIDHLNQLQISFVLLVDSVDRSRANN